MLNSFWTSSMYEQGLQQLQSTTSGVTFFFESWPCSALPLGSLPLVLPLKFVVRGTQHCHLHCRQVWNVFRIVVTCKYVQHFGHERTVNRNAVVMPINGSPSTSSNVFQAAKMDGFYDFLHPLQTCTKERLSVYNTLKIFHFQDVFQDLH